MRTYGHIHSLAIEFLDHKSESIPNVLSSDNSTTDLIPNYHNKDTDSTSNYYYNLSASSIANSSNNHSVHSIQIYIVYYDNIDLGRMSSFVVVGTYSSC